MANQIIVTVAKIVQFLMVVNSGTFVAGETMSNMTFGVNGLFVAMNVYRENTPTQKTRRRVQNAKREGMQILDEHALVVCVARAKGLNQERDPRPALPAATARIKIVQGRLCAATVTMENGILPITRGEPAARPVLQILTHVGVPTHVFLVH